MSIDTLVLLPLDERPINARYPRLLAAALGWGLDVPEALLGSRKRPADTAAIVDWLHHAASGAVGAVIALDTLAWGGLIPSRQSGNDPAAALARLEALRTLRRAHPRLPLVAFSSIQRVNREDDDGEEPAYSRTYGRRIFRRSVLEHRATVGALEGGERDELERLRAEVPADVWADVLAIRRGTHAVNLAALDLVADGVVDTLVLNQDDTTTWGLNVQDRVRLEAEVRRRDLGTRVLVYPGADEVAQVLIARLAARVHGRRPKVAVVFSARGGAGVQTGYEDRPLGDLVVTHLRSAGAVAVPAPLAPDWWLAVNAPSRAQGRGGTAFALRHDRHGVLSVEERARIEADEAQVRGLDRSLEAFADVLDALLEDGARVGLADVAHVNGADDELMTLLDRAGLVPRLAGYGGWNTAGNALGSAVALGCLASLVAPASEATADAHRLAVAARAVDDWLYQARTRARLLLDPSLRPFGLGGFIPAADLDGVAERARGWLNDELDRRGWPYRVARLALPWQRVFEIDYDLVPLPAPRADAVPPP
jgi:hypothetical protein